MQEWLQRTRRTRAIVTSALGLLVAGYFASRGMWNQAWSSVGIAPVGLALLIVPMPGRQAVPTLDIEKSVRKVGARRERP
ncbi:MAG: hypothetical protein ACYC2H_00445 [Thermoplasmatota archaeon]